MRIARAIHRRLGPKPRVVSPGELLADWARDRLVSLGLDNEELESLAFREAAIIYPNGWRERGNRVYVTASTVVRPDFIAGYHERAQASNLLIVLASPVDHLAVLGIHGHGATVYIGPECWMPGAQIHCGAESAVVLRRLVTCTFAGHVDARNGGAIFADEDQLWASRVYVATDDMHALRDAVTDQRLNGFGARIVLGRHVWLGQEAVVLGGATISHDCVVGMRSMVRAGSYASGSVLAGTPARAVRTGVSWSRDDSA